MILNNLHKLKNRSEIDDTFYSKLFVGGLSWESSQDSLQRYFSRYGEVIDCVVMKNNETGRSRGFGFVTFADPNNVGIVLQNGPHSLDGRCVVVFFSIKNYTFSSYFSTLWNDALAYVSLHFYS